ncbi:hypothetical protein CAPN008_16140 [Capnocytophaga canis]|uniref:DUF4302 domain-containing protein n=1 Tax=Capnocytophaga canis TaxID=1848903 RepID=UPI001AD3C214|nr:DUF4302 domain-containing protein [Capnocytophaga canis]GIM61564.1 hypothetical protein CAPN008_16140 [Capnocytophaga canis]
MKRYLFLIVLVGMISCKKEEPSEVSPSDRNLQNIKALRKELTEAPYGWKVLYFPKTDSLLFANKDEILEKDPLFRERYGYGGFYFLMKFDDKGTVQMRADYDSKSMVETKESEFEIKQNTFTQLSFTTFNYIHHLVNDRFSGNSDFMYAGRDFENNLVFKTASYIEPAREYVVFEKLKSPIDWEDKENQPETVLTTSYNNRKFFDRMKNPQVVIRKGSRIFFQSDMFVRTNTGTPQYNQFLREIIEKRYYLFSFNKKPDLINPRIAKESTGLGSGYVGTEQGLTFRTGLRYTEKYIFRDFERRGDKFVCELVKVYDPILKREMYVSKHLYPDGEPTYFIAEITDEGM